MLLVALAANAEVVVSAGRVPMASEDVSSSVTTITSRDLLTLQPATVPDALDNVPGVHVVRSGGPGQTASIYIRGSQSQHATVLIDGMDVNDPSLISRNADLSLLDVVDIDRIEVLRGPQSALYGADAMGGVINIITKRGAGDPSLVLSAEGGSYDTFRQSAVVSGGTGMVDYAFSIAHIESDGISAANKADGNTEEDGYGRTALSGRVGISPLDNLTVDLFARYSDSSVDYDNGAGPGADSPANKTDGERLFLGSSAKLSLFDSTWQQRLDISTVTHKRDFLSDWGANWYDAVLNRVRWQSDFYCVDHNTLSIGLEYENEQAATDALPEADSEIYSLHAMDQVYLGQWLVLSGGARVDDHDTFGDEFTYRIGATIKAKCTGTRIKGTYGTGFKAPSLYQLYAPESPWGPVGNADLQPETSKGWDVGLDQSLADGRVNVGVTYFDNTFENMIDFLAAGYVNVNEAETKGLEVSAGVQLCKDFRIDGSYTYTETENKEGVALMRNPKQRAAAVLRYTWDEVVHIALSGEYVGKRQDAYYNSHLYEVVDEELPDHVVVNLAASWDTCDTLTVFGRVENLFDKEYEQLAGYGTPGISAYGGLRITL